MLDFENDLLVLLSDVARHMRTYGNQLAQQHGTTFTQLTILERLERHATVELEHFRRMRIGTSASHRTNRRERRCPCIR